MADLFLRFGLWIIILVLVVFIGRESLEIQILQDAVEHSLLLLVGKVGIGLVGLGILLRMFGKVTPKKKSRCKVCKQPVRPGDIYCRQHLRDVLEAEDLRHRTMNVRRPDV